MPVYRVYAVKFAGPLTSSGAFLMWFKEWDRTVRRNYYLWCLRGDGPTVVVDAGVAPSHPAAGGLANYLSPARALERLGVRADQVEHLVLSHLHWDHASGLELFPRARVYVQEREFRFWIHDPLARRPPFAHLADAKAHALLASLEGSGRLALLQGDQEILPGVRCLLAPGHSVGLQAVAVQTEAGTAVLGSDCGHTFRNYREDWPSAIITDLVAWMHSMDKLRAAASRPELLFPGHDRLLRDDYPLVAEDVTLLA